MALIQGLQETEGEGLWICTGSCEARGHAVVSFFFRRLGCTKKGHADADKIQNQHGRGEQAHADGLGCGADDGCDQEDGENRVAEVAQEEFGVDDAEERQEKHEHRQLKRDAEPEDHGEEEAGVVLDGDHVRELLCRSRPISTFIAPGRT